MKDDVGISNSSMFASFVVGGLTGAAVALLLAPHSGRGTRSLVHRRIRDGLDRGQKAGERFAGKGREVLERASVVAGRHPRNEAGL